jgi:DNA-binding transcriptional regulator LsrR (DeoR family)
MKEDAIVKWLTTAELVSWYYRTTDMSLSQIAKRYNISYPKASNMLMHYYPKGVQRYLDKHPELKRRLEKKGIK